MITTQVGRMLDEEHRASLDLLDRVEQAMGRARQGDPQLAGLLARLAGMVDNDLGRHFRFEEEHVFPRLVEAGDGGIAQLMLQEHEDIREVAAELLPLVRGAAVRTLDSQEWDRLRLATLELVERELSHIQKETMAVLPALEDLLDADTDAELALSYAEA
jgi:hemerythrin-like domain-containing protein